MITQEERELYYVVKGSGGSFKTKLFETICAADLGNQAKLAMGFPEFVKAVQRYQNERGYWEKIEKMMNS
jgi:hypothetical protein